MEKIPYPKGRNANTGFFQGKVKNLDSEIEYAFEAKETWRDDQNQTLRIHGSMKDPENKAVFMVVALELSKHDQPSGTFLVGGAEIKLLCVGRYEPDVLIEAESGKVLLTRLDDDADGAIEGRLIFKTPRHNDDFYEVDVTFRFKPYER